MKGVLMGSMLSGKTEESLRDFMCCRQRKLNREGEEIFQQEHTINFPASPSVKYEENSRQ